MAEHSAIEWTDATWNPVVGCSIVSPGCINCYAMRMAARIEKMQPASHYTGTTKMRNGNVVWNGKLALAPDPILTAPLKWKSPRRIFVNSMGDLFHEDVPDDWIDKVFAVMALCPQHTFQVLTKRAKQMRNYLSEEFRSYFIGRSILDLLLTRSLPKKSIRNDNYPFVDGCDEEDHRLKTFPLPNVWLGVSAEDQARADERIPDLLATPAAIRFVSAEPLLGPVDFTRVSAKAGLDPHWSLKQAGLNWIITGGESGPDARPMHPDWARSIRNQCAAAGVPFFFKQWGEWQWASEDKNFEDAERHARLCLGKSVHLEHHSDGRTAARIGKARAGRLLDGRTHDAMPEMQRRRKKMDNP